MGPDYWNVRFFHPTPEELEKHQWEEVHQRRDGLINDMLDAVYEHLISRKAPLLRTVTIGDNSQPGYYGVFTLGPDGRFITKKPVVYIE